MVSLRRMVSRDKKAYINNNGTPRRPSWCLLSTRHDYSLDLRAHNEEEVFRVIIVFVVVFAAVIAIVEISSNPVSGWLVINPLPVVDGAGCNDPQWHYLISKDEFIHARAQDDQRLSGQTQAS